MVLESRTFFHSGAVLPWISGVVGENWEEILRKDSVFHNLLSDRSRKV